MDFILILMEISLIIYDINLSEWHSWLSGHGSCTTVYFFRPFQRQNCFSIKFVDRKCFPQKTIAPPPTPFKLNGCFFMFISWIPICCRAFSSGRRQHASRVTFPCGLMMIKNFPRYHLY